VIKNYLTYGVKNDILKEKNVRRVTAQTPPENVSEESLYLKSKFYEGGTFYA